MPATKAIISHDESSMSSPVSCLHTKSQPLDDRRHIYRSLDRTNNSIRLISIHRETNGPIHGQLHNYAFDSCPPFIALSYTWDSSPEDWMPCPKTRNSRNIILDGEDFEVRNNLHLALNMILARKMEVGGELTYMLNPRYWQFFWIDALCINQENLLERNHQVNMMGEIFAGAAFVMAWLGPPSDDSDLAFDSILSLRTTKDYVYPFDTPEKQAVESLRDCKYWQRIWIIQEFVLAPDVVLACGTRHVLLRELKYYLEVIRVWGVKLNSHGTVLKQRELRERSRKSGKSTDLIDLVIRFSDSKCAEPRDHVFGLLGLVDKEYELKTPHGLLLEADYSVSIECLYDRIMRAALKKWFRESQLWLLSGFGWRLAQALKPEGQHFRGNLLFKRWFDEESFPIDLLKSRRLVPEDE
ncbi:hypothetical protein FKW77_010798 [Venturia effusa]|uniref:Heterokaryon incompatibility domain-containing protein n=1 Tax=Venturia effusa TaxID=50376 RepID=A0A517KYI2_9PEZI|nr:hypothetical protein FKW77_010798 [Venturia effusa]